MPPKRSRTTIGTKQDDGTWEIDGLKFDRVGEAGQVPAGATVPIIWGDEGAGRQPLALGREFRPRVLGNSSAPATRWPRLGKDYFNRYLLENHEEFPIEIGGAVGPSVPGSIVRAFDQSLFVAHEGSILEMPLDASAVINSWNLTTTGKIVQLTLLAGVPCGIIEQPLLLPTYEQGFDDGTNDTFNFAYNGGRADCELGNGYQTLNYDPNFEPDYEAYAALYGVLPSDLEDFVGDDPPTRPEWWQGWHAARDANYNPTYDQGYTDGGCTI